MIYSALYIQAADFAIPVVWAPAGLMVATRSLVETTLGMRWQTQAKKLEEMAGRWKTQTLTVKYASGKTVTQHCLPAARLVAYLWSLRPVRPASREALTLLQDQWEGALETFLGSKGEQAAGEIWALQERLKATEKSLEAAQRQGASLAGREMGMRSAAQMVRARQQRGERPVNKKVAVYRGADWWLALQRAVDDLGTVASVARRLGFSRPTLSRVLNEDYPESSAKSVEIAVREKLSGYFPPDRPHECFPDDAGTSLMVAEGAG